MEVDMKVQNQRFIVHFLSLLACMSVTAGAVNAGGLVEIDIDFDDDFDDSLNIDNPYWPLQPGNVFVYQASEDDECVVNIIEVTDMQKSFVEPYDNVIARVVQDTEWADDGCDGIPDGDALETTEDWYAQDDFGHIWYFGEETEDEDGSTEGSWEAGMDVADVGSIAEPGIIMLAFPATATEGSVIPAPGLFYAQEYYEDEAEDMGKVKRLKTNVTPEMENTLDDEYTGCLVTKEWTPLDPGAVEFKYYCPYVGLVLIEELQGGPTVRVELTDINP